MVNQKRILQYSQRKFPYEIGISIAFLPNFPVNCHGILYREISDICITPRASKKSKVKVNILFVLFTSVCSVRLLRTMMDYPRNLLFVPKHWIINTNMRQTTNMNALVLFLLYLVIVILFRQILFGYQLFSTVSKPIYNLSESIFLVGYLT